ncbi:MAG: LacI family DNA-binding transcriptional regulator [Atopobium sp.]|nr:LacI family DNA-binding transcriptional regulator [Atopobium sp.]
MAEKVTLKTIAREVGLSPATVSLVLNGRPVRVSDENRRRILDVARREHYIPNQIARSLVTQHTQTLGLIVPNIESRFFSSFAKMLEMKCRRRGYALFITNSDNSTSNDADLVRLLVNRGADGIFIITSDEVEASKQLIADLEQLPVPYVMVDRTIDALDCDKVTFNNELGGYLATKYLLDHGHRRIACMVNTASNTGCARLNGYVRALGEKGLELDQSLVLTSDYYIPDAYLAAQQLIRVNATAVVATSDNIALGLLRYLYERGLHVPRDYSVVGYDNSISDALFEPALTSIEQNVDELSDAALSIMFRRLGERGADVEAAGQAAAEVDAAGQENADDTVDDSASIQIILEPRMIEKNSVRVLGR